MSKSFKLQNGMLLLSTEAPGGIYNSAQLKKIATLAEGDSAIVKATEDQRLALLVRADKVAKVAEELKALGLGIRHYQSGLHQATTCLGEMCPEFQQDAMSSAIELSNELAEEKTDAPLKVGINGCARCCVPTHTLDISIVGDVNGYRLSLGGKNSQIPEMASFMAEGVPAEQLPKLVRKIVKVYKELSKNGETLQEVMEQHGPGRFISALAPYSQDAAGAGDDPFGASAAPGDAESSDGGSEELSTDELAIDGPTAQGTESELAFDQAPGVEDLSDSSDLELPGPEVDIAEGTESNTDEELLSSDLTSDSLEAQDQLLSEDDNLQLDEEALDSVDVGDELASSTSAADDEQLAQLAAEEASLEGGSDSELQLDESVALDLGESAGDDSLEMMESEADEIPLAADKKKIALVKPATSTSDDLDSMSLEGLPDEGLSTGDEAPDEDFETLESDPAPAVAAAPKLAKVAASAPEDSVSEEMQAEEIADDEADAFEAKLTASIEEEEANPAPFDENLAPRLETMRLVEAEKADVALNDSLHVEDGFDNLGIEDHAHDEHAHPGDEQHALDETQGDDSPAAGPGRASSHGNSSAMSGELVGMELTAEGRIAVSFSGGASLLIDPKSHAKGSAKALTIAGKRVVIAVQKDAFSIEVEGVGLRLPMKAA